MKKYQLMSKKVIDSFIQMIFNSNKNDRIDGCFFFYSIWKIGQNGYKICFYNLLQELNHDEKYEFFLYNLLSFEYVEDKEKILNNVENLLGTKFEDKIHKISSPKE